MTPNQTALLNHEHNRPRVFTFDTSSCCTLRDMKKAQRLAQRTTAFVVQANWPNSLNYPEESASLRRA